MKQQQQRGMTLIELMISMVLSLGLIAGISSLFIQMQKGNKVQRGFSAMSDDSSYVQEVLQKELRRAGGLRSRTDINGTASVVFLGGANHATEVGSDIGLAVGQYIRGDDDLEFNDSFVMRYQLVDATDLGASAVSSGNSPCTQNVLLNAGEDPALQTQVVSVYFFLTGDGTLSCTAQRTQNFPGSATPEACIKNCTSTTNFTPMDDFIPLISNVDRLMLNYGVDTNNDNAADYYVNAATVPDTASCLGVVMESCWNHIVSVRLTVVVQSEEDNLAQTPMKYQFNGSNIVPNDHRLYKSFTSTIALRN